MAYVFKENKEEVSNKILPILKKYGLKGSLSVSSGKHELILTIWEGSIDFIGNYNEVMSNRHWDNFEHVTDNIDINQYHFDNQFSGIALEALSEIIPAMEIDGFYNHDDIQSDYFSRSYYFSVKIGRSNRPYVVTSPKTEKVKQMTRKTVSVPNYDFSSNSIQELIEELNAMNTMVDNLVQIENKVDVSSATAAISDMVSAMTAEISKRTQAMAG